jgi:cysteine desulfurase/selenocysteine lyase
MTLQVRDDFPLLRRKIDGVGIAYLDSAATALKPTSVLAAETAYLTEYTANVHRGHSALGDEASFAYEAARRKIAAFIGAQPATVVFTPNTSYGIAAIAAGLGLSPHDKVLCSSNSHHATMLPWLRRHQVAFLDGDPLLPIDPDHVQRMLKELRPKVVSIGWASNVTGVINPVAQICRLAREYGALSVVDAAQAAPHLPIDVESVGCDFLTFSAHKMLGPTGIGVMHGRRELLERLEPLVVSGGSVDRVLRDGYTLKRSPQRFEPGTPHISGAIGFGAAVEYLERLGFEAIQQHEHRLRTAMSEFFSDLPGVRVLSAPSGSPGLAIASVVPTEVDIHSDALCQILSESYKVMTRSGFHCAHPLFDGQGFQRGAVRLSAYIYNTVEEVRRAGDALRTTLRRFTRAR